jgi:small GTP-binding protein
MEEKIVREVIQLGTLGDSGVGKSNLSSVYVNNKFEPEIIATIGFNCLIKDTIIKINNIEKKIKIKIWDTAGQEKFKSVSVQYIKNCIGILLVYSIDDRNSLNNLENWIKDIKDKTNYEKVPLILIGNKCDLEDERKVSKEEGEKFALKYNIKFFECSAKNNINVNQAFESLINEVVENYQDEFISENDKGIKIEENINKTKKEGCCGKKKKGNEKNQN